MKKRSLKFLATILFPLVLSSSGWAQSYEHNSEEIHSGIDGMMYETHPPMNHWPHSESGHHRGKFYGNAAEHFLHLKDRLGLNQNQIENLKKLRDSYRSENTLNEARLQMDRKELRELLQEETVSIEKAEAKIKEISALEIPIRISSVKQFAKIKTILSKEQLERLQHTHLS